MEYYSFHYRSHGTDYGRVLVVFEQSDSEALFERHLAALGYYHHDETNNASFKFFLAPQSNYWLTILERVSNCQNARINVSLRRLFKTQTPRSKVQPGKYGQVAEYDCEQLLGYYQPQPLVLMQYHNRVQPSIQWLRALIQ